MAEKSPTVLLVEHDKQLGQQLHDALRKKRYQVSWERAADVALDRFDANDFDICVVNDVLPGMSGLDFGKKLRQIDYSTPILFMSASDNDRDKIEAFCSGADDYIVKPFSPTELLLRVYALLRRSQPKKMEKDQPDLMQFGEFTFDYPNRLLCTTEGDTPLTKKEAEVLRMLAVNINNVVKRENVLTTVWGENDYFMGRSMDVYIARLRKKLAHDQRVSIVNVHRMGFKLEVKPAAEA